MPRRPDSRLEERILHAAHKLWQRGGANALTMRVIATPGTNTPTIYRRLKNRNDIVFALAQRVQQDVVKTLQPSRSPEETCVRYIEFASRHPHEYTLFLGYPKELWQSVRSRDQSVLWNSTPFVVLIRKQLAERRRAPNYPRGLHPAEPTREPASNRLCHPTKVQRGRVKVPQAAGLGSVIVVSRPRSSWVPP